VKHFPALKAARRAGTPANVRGRPARLTSENSFFARKMLHSLDASGFTDPPVTLPKANHEYETHQHLDPNGGTIIRRSDFIPTGSEFFLRPQ